MTIWHIFDYALVAGGGIMIVVYLFVGSLYPVRGAFLQVQSLALGFVPLMGLILSGHDRTHVLGWLALVCFPVAVSYAFSVGLMGLTFDVPFFAAKSERQKITLFLALWQFVLVATTLVCCYSNPIITLLYGAAHGAGDFELQQNNQQIAVAYLFGAFIAFRLLLHARWAVKREKDPPKWVDNLLLYGNPKDL